MNIRLLEVYKCFYC